MITLLLITSLLVCTLYVVWTIKQGGGLPSSISATYYRIRHKWVFQVAMFLSGGLLMPAMLEITPEPIEFLAFLGCAGVILVGASPNFKDEMEGRIHTVGAGLLLVCSQLLVALLTPYLLLAWGGLIAHLVVRLNKTDEVVSLRGFFASARALFWAEIIAILTTYTMLLWTLYI